MFKVNNKNAKTTSLTLLNQIYNLFLNSNQCYIPKLPENIRKPQGFLVFPGGIEMKLWEEMG